MFMSSTRIFNSSGSLTTNESARQIFSLTFVFLIALCGSVAADLKVESKPNWGFDGTIQVEDFNLLTVEVFNNSEKNWEGSVWVKPIVGIQSVDLPVIQPDLFIEPYGKRQLQFYVFVPDRTEYNLAWGKIRNGRLFAEDSYKIDSPKVSYKKVVVQLTNLELNVRTVDLPTFDEQNFPSSATVLNPVKGFVLDHVPRWQKPQTQAFRDWLFGGGTLYLVSSDSASLLEFPASLSELNEPSDEFPVGYGRVIRTQESIKAERAKQNPNNTYKNLSSSGTIFSLLKAMTTPDHNWGLIYTLASVYLLILFPGCWLLGRKKGDFRLTYTVVLATVALFSFGFHSIGKRGYGEETTVNSVAFVKPGQPGRWVVKQWSNLFITGGGDYDVTHEVDSSAISTGQHTEAVRGMAINQPAAAMRSDIPSFSNRTVIHTGVLKSQGFRPEATQIESTQGQLQALELSMPEGTQWPEMSSKIAIHRDRIYDLSLSNGKLHMVGNGRQATQLEHNSLVYNHYGWGNQAEITGAGYFDKAFWLMVADDLGLFHGENLEPTTLPEDVVRVYLQTEMDSTFFAKGENFPQQVGKVLYSFDFHADLTE